MPGAPGRPLLTFRLDAEQRRRLRARLAREGRTMSEVVTNGLRQYVKAVLARGEELARGDDLVVLPRGDDPPETAGHGGALRPSVSPGTVSPRPPRLPDPVAARLRELRSSGRSELLSATLAALAEAGWPLRSLAEALGISRQAVQARIRRRVPAELREHVMTCEPPPPFPHRRTASTAGLRPHLTIKIDHALRAAAHRAAAYEGSSLSQVVESILDRYLRQGMPGGDQSARPASRPARRPERRSR